MILDRIFSRSLSPTDPGRRGGPLIFGLPSAGIRVNEDTALNYSAVWAAVSTISQTIGIVSWQVFEREDGIRRRVFDSPLARLLNVQPNPEMTPSTVKQTLAAHALLWGNAYAEIERSNSGRPIALWPLHPSLVEPKRAANGKLVYEIKQDGSDPVVLPADDVFAPVGMSMDGIVGVSPIQKARESISMGLAMENYGASFFGNDARPSYVIEAPDKLGEKAEQNLRDWVDRNHGGRHNKWRPGVLEQGTTLKTIGMPNDDAQFLESRKFQIGEIARWFNIPPHKIGDLERATFNNIDSRERMYVTEAVLPWARGFEEEANRKLVAPSSRNRVFTKFNLNTLMRGDVQTRGAFYNTMFNIGAYSPNDIRSMEDQNPVRGGNVRMVPGNMVPLTQAGSQMAPQQAMFDVFADVAGRMLRREYKTIARAHDEGTIESTGRDRWLLGFYRQHRDYMIEAFKPPVSALAQQHEAQMPSGALARYATDHCSRAADALSEADDIKQAAYEWSQRDRDVASEVIDAVSDGLTVEQLEHSDGANDE